MNRIIVVAAAMAAVLLFGASATAQPCCTATGASELSVVGRCHQAVAASQLSYDRGVASYDAQGDAHLREQASTDDVVLTLGAGTRVFSERLQIHGGLPLRLQRRGAADEDATGWGLGDAAAELRWTPIYDPMSGIGPSGASFLPFVDLFVGAKFPTGRAPEDGSDSSGADVTGDGAWAATGGVRLTKFLTSSHVLTLQADLAHSFARDIPTPRGDMSFARGLESGYKLGYTHLFDLFWSAGANVDLRVRGATQLDGGAVPDSEYHRVRVGAHVTRVIAFPYWEVTLAGSTDTFAPGLGRNVPAVGPSASLTLRRTFP